MTDFGMSAPLGQSVATRHHEGGPLRHREWMIVMSTIAHVVLGAYFCSARLVGAWVMENQEPRP